MWSFAASFFVASFQNPFPESPGNAEKSGGPRQRRMGGSLRRSCTRLSREVSNAQRQGLGAADLKGYDPCRRLPSEGCRLRSQSWGDLAGLAGLGWGGGRLGRLGLAKGVWDKS